MEQMEDRLSNLDGQSLVKSKFDPLHHKRYKFSYKMSSDVNLGTSWQDHKPYSLFIYPINCAF